MIIAVGFKVNSERAMQFRKWRYDGSRNEIDPVLVYASCQAGDTMRDKAI
jgi:hypothetical protein